nr:disease resistance protein RPS5-like [Solanum lycopersicum]
MMPRREKILPASSLVGEFAQRSLEAVWEYLNDEHSGISGIYGKGGVGKTSILVEINNRLLRESKKFDNVIWVTASNDSTVQKFQKDIARVIEFIFMICDCNLLITTRSMVVCRGMESVREVEVSILSEEEAWNLFKQKVGEEVLASPTLQAVAKDVSKECGGLPLAVVRRENDLRQWKNALSQLKSATGRIEGMENRVFARL